MTSKHSDINAKIGLKIKLIRTKLGLSQEKCAELSELSQNALGAIERGQSQPTINTLARIADALNTELKELVDITKIDL